MKKEEIRKNNLPTSDSHLGGGSLESKRNPGGNRKKIPLIVVGILLTLGIAVGVSYAWWTHTISQEGINTIQSTCLEIELADENPITLQNAYPITDLEASLLPSYTFTIKNKCNTLLEYDVNLDIMESKDSEGVDNRLSSSYVAIEFNGGEKKLLNTLESVETSYPKTDYTPVEGRYLVSGELGSNESKSYSLKLWMDESVTVEDDAMNKNFISKVVVTAKQSHAVRLVDYVMNDNETEEFEHEATYQTKALTDYRYTGVNPNNYVYFGCEGDTCTEDNLYRIIGVMPTQSEVGGEYENRVKLIKASDYTETESGYLHGTNSYDWSTNKNNKWEEATLNTRVLNGVYWNNLGDYQKYIASSVWYLGAPNQMTTENGSGGNYLSSNDLYKLERSNQKGKSNGVVTYINNIGLLYPSDFGYTIKNLDEKEFINSKIEYNIQNSWLIFNESFWTISPEAGFLSSTYGTAAWVILTGSLSSRVVFNSNYSTAILPTFPTFYLKSNVLYESGNGSQENPFRININE